MKSKFLALILQIAFLSLLSGGKVLAEEKAASNADANNPLSNMTAFNIQDYYITELTDSDETANQAWLRYATPLAIGETKWIVRASLPINSFPTSPDGDTETGVGDLNVFAAYLMDIGRPGVSFGIGPLLTAPTAAEDELGSGKWEAGIANVLFNASSKVFQYGYLLTWQASFAGDDDREDVNVAALQPFLYYQLGGGTYLRSSAVWVYDLENDTYNVPLGIGIGKVFKRGKAVYNIFVEPQFSVAYEGAGQPETQVFMGFNLQFPN
jgi:hypothetical protein